MGVGAHSLVRDAVMALFTGGISQYGMVFRKYIHVNKGCVSPVHAA